ncbi:unnamed protein product [Phytomonas sp. EM1]|nr:unnamed protein product [Phytomonas sp. EM1]|eukprot:CCW65019.1 unnamed protein product [Phytomonas sp. isolate EM1]
MHPPKAAIRCMAVLSDEESPFPLFIGRDDGVVEKYISIRDADLGIPSLTLLGHRKAVTGIIAISADEVLSCSLDGTLREWNADLGMDKNATRLLRNVDPKVPLHCITRQGERIYLGGGDGSLHIVDGERRSMSEGHCDVLSCIAFAEDGNLFVTGGHDHQILIWDVASAKPIRRLLGHSNRVIGVCVVPHPDLEGEGDEDEGRVAGRGDRAGPRLDGAIVSFSKDRTMKVWLLPNPSENFSEEAEETREKQLSSVHNDSSMLSNDANDSASKALTETSFKEGAHGEVDGAGALPRQEHSKGSLGSDNLISDTKDNSKRVSFMSPDDGSAGDALFPKVHPAEGADGDPHSFPSEDVVKMIRTSLTPKSALKPREMALMMLPLVEAVGTIELPEIPFTLFRPSILFGEEDGQSQPWSLMALVGAANGYVWGMNLARLTRNVLLFVRDNNRKVAAATSAAKRTLRENIVLLKKGCRKRVFAKTNSMIEVARKRKSEEVAAARAAKIAQRKKDFAHENAEEDEEGSIVTNEEVDLDMGYEEDEEDEEEVENINDSDGRLRYLTAEEKTELEGFIKDQETERDAHIQSLQSAVSSHLDKLSPIARTPYVRGRDRFYRLRHIAAARVGCETVLAVVRGFENVYAVQGERVVITQVTPGLTNL